MERMIKEGASLNGADYAEQIRNFRGRYDLLVEKLGTYCTEISRRRVLEDDPDIEPYHYVRNAEHVFIFPPQDSPEIRGHRDGVVPGTTPYTLEHDSFTRDFDKGLVEGGVRLTFDDANNRPELAIGSAPNLPDGALPEVVTELLHQAFADEFITT